MDTIHRIASRVLHVVRHRGFAASVLAVTSASVMTVTSVNADVITGLSADKVVLSMRNDPYVVQADNVLPLYDMGTGFDVTVTADGTTTLLRVQSGTVADALDTVGITVSAEDILSASREATLTSDMSIEVQRVTYREYTENQAIPYETKTTNDNTMNKGTSKVTVEGKDGEKAVTYREMLVDGEVVERNRVSEEILTQPVTKQVVQGTYVKPQPATPIIGKYTEDDLYCLAVAIYREAGSDYLTDEHRAMVACVVMNRVQSKLFPNSIRGVLTQYGQYQGMWTNGVHFPSGAADHAVQRAYRIAREVLEGKWSCPSNVVFQANFPQGSGTYRVIAGGGTYTYFCYQ